MMNWSDVGSAILKFAPLAGEALISPVGAVAGLGAIIANLFGSDATPEGVMDYIKSNPDKATERLQFEMANNLDMQRVALNILQENNRSKERNLELENERLKAINEDTANARANSVNIGTNNIYSGIAIILVIGSFCGAAYCLHIIGSTDVSPTESPLVSMALGMFLAFIAAPVGFIFGSSMGSQIKDGFINLMKK